MCLRRKICWNVNISLHSSWIKEASDSILPMLWCSCWRREHPGRGLPRGPDLHWAANANIASLSLGLRLSSAACGRSLLSWPTWFCQFPSSQSHSYCDIFLLISSLLMSVSFQYEPVRPSSTQFTSGLQNIQSCYSSQHMIFSNAL